MPGITPSTENEYTDLPDPTDVEEMKAEAFVQAAATPKAQTTDCDLLANILAAFGTKPKKGAAPAPRKALPRNAKPLSFPEAFNELKTGYRIWKALARVIYLEEQNCECCGSRTTSVKDEMFLLSNTVSKSAWIRHEGYGIEASEDLPVQFHHLDPRTVSFCATCASSDIDAAISHVSSAQLHLPI